MDLVAHLESLLLLYQTNPPTADLRIKGWRFSLNEFSSVKVGIRDNRMGEVYAAPSIDKNFSGDLLIIWPGDYCSHTVVNSAVIKDMPQKLSAWRLGAYLDPEGAVLLSPQSLPLVAVEYQEVQGIVNGNPAPLFELLDRYRHELPAWGVSNIQAGSQAGWGVRHIRTSSGLAVSYAQTTFSTYLSADGLFSQSFAKRRLPSAGEVDALIRETGEVSKYLRQEADFDEGETTVIFAPQLVESFVAKYLLPNLSGNNVVNHQGAYMMNDFLQRRKVFDDRISVQINPLKSFELSSYLCTREGVPARTQWLVERGRLLTPYLTVKDSIKAGLRPTPLPQGTGLWLEAEGSRRLPQLVSGLESGLLVYSVLGLHTQDSTSGNYSLSAPQCLKIEKGKVIGRVKAVISGNFLQHLADSATLYGTVPGANAPAMQFECKAVKG